MEEQKPQKQKNSFDALETVLKRYKHVLGLAIFAMMIVLSILAYHSFDKQNQIIETGGYTDGKVQCVCTQEAWDRFILEQDTNKGLVDLVLQDNG